MRHILNIIAVILVTLATAFLRYLCQAHEIVFVFGVFGAISFFIGPYFTGSGFFARGFQVDTATIPGCGNVDHCCNHMHRYLAGRLENIVNACS
jgi:hypothetical protein